MLKDIRDQLWRSCVFTLLFTAVIGLAYPLAVTLVSRACFPRQAGGSIIESGGKAVGSELIGQSFSSPRYFWGRPSATGPFAYNAGLSSGSNLGPLNPLLIASVRGRAVYLRRAGGAERIPIDLVTASASGLDPHISPEAAYYQVSRVARERNIDVRKVRVLVAANIEKPFLGFIGGSRVNVLRLNLELNGLNRGHRSGIK